MKCPQKIVLTVKHGLNNIDVELPTNNTIDELKRSIVNTMNMYCKEKEVNDSLSDDLKLYHKDNELDESKILANYGIWDGSVIELR